MLKKLKLYLIIYSKINRSDYVSYLNFQINRSDYVSYLNFQINRSKYFFNFILLYSCDFSANIIFSSIDNVK